MGLLTGLCACVTAASLPRHCRITALRHCGSSWRTVGPQTQRHGPALRRSLGDWRACCAICQSTLHMRHSRMAAAAACNSTPHVWRRRTGGALQLRLQRALARAWVMPPGNMMDRSCSIWHRLAACVMLVKAFSSTTAHLRPCRHSPPWQPLIG